MYLYTLYGAIFKNFLLFLFDLLFFDRLIFCFIKAIWDFQIFQGLGLVCDTLERHRKLFRKDSGQVTTPSKAIKPKVSGIQASSVVTVISPLGNTVVVQITVHYSTTETHEVIWAYNILGHMIPVKGNNFFCFNYQLKLQNN